MNFKDLHWVNVGNSSFVASAADIFNGNPSSDIVSMENHNDVYFLLAKGAGATGTATITVGSCDTTVPGTATAVPFEYRAQTSADTWGEWTAAEAAGFTTTAGANQMYQIHIKGSDLSGTNKFVRLTATEVVNSPCEGYILAAMASPRFTPTPATVLS